MSVTAQAYGRFRDSRSPMVAHPNASRDVTTLEAVEDLVHDNETKIAPEITSSRNSGKRCPEAADVTIPRAYRADAWPPIR